MTEMTYAIERLFDEIEEQGIEKGIEKGALPFVRILIEQGKKASDISKEFDVPEDLIQKIIRALDENI